MLLKPKAFALWTAIVALACVFTISLGGCFSQPNALWIAVPLNGNNSGEKNLQEMINSIQIYVDKVNQTGGVNGRRLKVRQVNDQGTVAGARTAAHSIARDSRALAVIGSFNSFLSIAAGEIYREFGVPAVTGSSTAEAVTKGNDWYFRVTFDNFLQGKFLAYYMDKVLRQSSAIITYDPQEPYSNSLAQSFTKEYKQLGGKIAQQWTINGAAKNLDEQAARIAYEIEKFQKGNFIDAVVIPTLEPVAAKVIVALKHRGLTYPILGGNTLGNQTFLSQFKDYPEEKSQPGYFTDGIITTAPVIFDILGEESQAFKSEFRQKYGTEPTYVGALYYDTAKVLVAAMQRAGVQGNPENIADERRQIRN
ncbi:MAG: ABC transporter substrate-binding protein, partial [Chroococcidiopsidaceae cyanobacterium CP_BM_RX_35]|nr:ABC transporter substrate-binding protein [Chroococcidiopsidaceae cyanobacterium CP_BM_RX_35]